MKKIFTKSTPSDRGSSNFAITLAAASAMFLIAGAMFLFVLIDSYGSFSTAWRMVFGLSIGFLLLAAGCSGFYARRKWSVKTLQFTSAGK